MALHFHLYYWPILTSVWISFTFLISYLVAVYDGHVYELLPYISDTGSLPPESCIFGEMLNIGALLMLITMYIRYRTVALLHHRTIPTKYKMWNKSSNLFGILSCLGLTLVANFQETSEINVHTIGAFLTFAVGAVYCIVQAYLTWLSYSGIILKCTRFALSLLLIPMYVVTSVCSAISFGKIEKGKDFFKWNGKDSGYDLHLVATFTEWAMALVMILYIATFYVEFKLVEFNGISFVSKM